MQSPAKELRVCENIQLTGFVFKFPLLRMLLRIATHCYGFQRIGGMSGQDWILREGASKSLAHAPIGSQNALLRSSEGPWELLDPKIENMTTGLLQIYYGYTCLRFGEILDPPVVPKKIWYLVGSSCTLTASLSTHLGAEHCPTDAATDCYELLWIATDTHNKSTLV